MEFGQLYFYATLYFHIFTPYSLYIKGEVTYDFQITTTFSTQIRIKNTFLKMLIRKTLIFMSLCIYKLQQFEIYTGRVRKGNKSIVIMILNIMIKVSLCSI